MILPESRGQLSGFLHSPPAFSDLLSLANSLLDVQKGEIIRKIDTKETKKVILFLGELGRYS